LSAWIRHFFTDLENAKSSVFYAALGSVGKAFMEIEEAAFEMS
jgi:TorA maturation chaperone TorD